MPYQHPPEQYSTIPTRKPARTLGLARVILTVAPKKSPPSVVKRLGRVHTRAVGLQSAWIEANRPAEAEETPRSSDIRVDRNWRVCFERVEHWVKVDHPKKAEEAAEMLELLFPTGLAFTNLPFDEEWAESERRVVLIKNDELGPALADLIDQRFVDSLHQAHADYGKILGITQKQADDEPPPSVSKAVKALREELSAYARLICGLADPDDDEAIAAAEAQLAPIIHYRRLKAKSSGAQEPEELEQPMDAPVPEPPQASEASEADEGAAQEAG